MAAALIGIVLGPWLSRRFGKKWAAVGMFTALILVSITPVSLRLLGLMPPNGSDIIVAVLLAESLLIGADADDLDGSHLDDRRHRRG